MHNIYKSYYFFFERNQKFRHPTRLVGKESSCVLFCLIRKTWECSTHSAQGVFHASFLWSNKFPLLKLRHTRDSPCSKLKNKYSHTNWMNLMRFILLQEPVINCGLEKNKMPVKSEREERKLITFFKGLCVRCQDNPLIQKQIFRMKIWHHPKLLPLNSNADGWNPITLHKWN